MVNVGQEARTRLFCDSYGKPLLLLATLARNRRRVYLSLPSQLPPSFLVFESAETSLPEVSAVYAKIAHLAGRGSFTSPIRRKLTHHVRHVAPSVDDYQQLHCRLLCAFDPP